MNWLKVTMVLVVLAILLSLASWVLADDSKPIAGQAVGPAALGSDSNPSGPPVVIVPEAYRVTGEVAVAAAATPATVYFAPQDENTSTTVMFLYNTSAAAASVGIQAYTLSGALNLSTSVNVPAHGLVRICADTVSTISNGWQNVVLVNFTTFSAYGKLTLPPGVKADGYVVWNNADTYDPLQVAPTLPLRFTADPATVFLPTVTNN